VLQLLGAIAGISWLLALGTLEFIDFFIFMGVNISLIIAFASNMTALVIVLSKVDDISTRVPKPKLYWFLLASVSVSFISTLILLYVEPSLMAPIFTFSVLASFIISAITFASRRTEDNSSLAEG